MRGYSMKKLITVLSVFACSMFAQVTGPTPANPTAAKHVPDRIVVCTVPTADPGSVTAAIKKVGGKVHHGIPEINVLVLDVPEVASFGVMRSLKARTSLFTCAERDPIGQSTAKLSWRPLMAIPPGTTGVNDTSIANQPWVGTEKFQSLTNSQGAWDATQGSATMPIGIIDSGVNGTHADLAAKMVPGWNFLTGVAVAIGTDSDTGCNTGHGTAVSGTAAASTNNAAGIAGAGWKHPIMPLVVTSSACFAYWTDVAN